MKAVTVYCGSSTALDEAYEAAASAAGAAIAARGLDLVYGGGCIGLMGVVAEAASAGGATVVGVITHKLRGWEQANDECDEMIVVDTMQQRRAIMAERGDAFLVLPGGIGTFEECIEALVGRQIAEHDKPIALVNVRRYFDPFLAMIDHGLVERFMRPALRSLMVVEDDPVVALERILDAPLASPPTRDLLPMHSGDDG